MPNYIRTGPFTNGGAPGISAAFLNAVETVLEQPSGGTETGKYFLLSQTYANLAQFSNYLPSLSRTSVPVSVTIDEADQGHIAGNCNPAITGHLTANGFYVDSSGTAANTACQVAGNTTINF